MEMNNISIEDVKKATNAYVKIQEDELEKLRKEEEEAKTRAEGILKFFKEIETMEGINDIKKLLEVNPLRRIDLFSKELFSEHDRTSCSFDKDGFNHFINDRERFDGSQLATNREIAAVLAERGYTGEQLSEKFFTALNAIVSNASA
ncbi:MAG: hypothetical protein M0P76_01400 [Candidatus Pacebacteria bacterium]|nr:hypothetical protein [Candidatus Paceibacterota bacterium]